MNIFVAGHQGMVGKAITQRLQDQGHEVLTRTRAQLDLTDQTAVRRFLSQQHIDEVYVAAGKVGGIHANSQYPAEFLYDNLAIASNLIHGSFVAGIRRLLYLGSSCIYPRMAAQPMREEALLSGTLESTNEPYAIAKIAGIKLCETYNRQYGHSHGIDFRSVMPTNLYGPGDNYHPENSHVLPALLQRFHDAKTLGWPEVQVWGSGKARREFLYVEDLADGCLHVMNMDKRSYDANVEPTNSHINIGTGQEVSIEDLAALICTVVGYTGEIRFDASRPDGTPRKLLDVSRLDRMGWKHRVPLVEGVYRTYADFLNAVPRNRQAHYG
ncbi:GDP-L-fucose synthase [Xylophilus sp. GOD-11R]|uniref:GDP-L-fucose synthase family protein n=1 Tax=Xylophilus sp. GOD-11R TaxID=3089814 RepID=UPI00298D3744|nr:GDP-L-fucose synthase [Xylophilus sp. GOD-11R]WPB55482.1 GDP-L-fucose synthase [Xylophilus sp. GOD-11R]